MAGQHGVQGKTGFLGNPGLPGSPGLRGGIGPSGTDVSISELTVVWRNNTTGLYLLCVKQNKILYSEQLQQRKQHSELIKRREADTVRACHVFLPRSARQASA